MVSVDYLIRPLEIFKEVNRVLRPGGKFILSQSNRCFPTKAIAMWLGMSDLQHCLVIGAYLHHSTPGPDPNPSPNPKRSTLTLTLTSRCLLPLLWRLVSTACI